MTANQTDITDGTLVKVSSPDNFRGFKLGVFMGICKKDGGYKVHLTDSTSPVPDICIVPDRGDTIMRITK